MRRIYFVSSPYFFVALAVLFTAACVQDDGHGPLTAESREPVLDETWAADDGQELLELLTDRYRERLEASPTGMVQGRVVDLSDLPVANVEVTIGQATTRTRADGTYVLRGIPAGAHVISFQHPEYVYIQRAVMRHLGTNPRMDARLMNRSKPTVFDASKEAVITRGPITLTFEPDDLDLPDPSNTLVEIVFTAVDPHTRGHIEAAPAPLEGIDENGNLVGLFSYGMLEVELYQDGAEVHVRAGQTVTSELRLDAADAALSGGSIPMWHHDVTRAIWVQEPNLHANIQEDASGALIASVELPHFSSWNYDSVADAGCARLPVQTSADSIDARVVSTNSAGVMDNIWSITSQCMPMNGDFFMCVTNIPTRPGVYFKIQARENSGSWEDVKFAYQGVELTPPLNGSTFAGTTPTWCGPAEPTMCVGCYVTGDRDLGNASQIPFPNGSINFGPAAPYSGLVTSTIGPRILTNGSNSDSGLVSMWNNSLTTTYGSNYDRDSAVDTADTCLAKTTASQTDANGNGVGDLCESWCYVPSSDPWASYYDYDGDEVDDYCDNNMGVWNPSQYLP